VVAVGSLHAGPARAEEVNPAQPSADAVAQARSHFTHGVKLYEEDDFRAAVIEFNRAYELAPNWAVLYNVGQSYYQLRDYANALRILEKYEALGAASIPADRRAQVEKEVVELRGRLAHVAVLSNVVGAEILMDDAVLGQTPLPATQVVGAGRHTFRAAKTGYIAASQILDVAGGDNLTVTLTLAEATKAVEPAERTVSFAPAIASLVVGGVGIVTGSVFGALALGDKSSLKTECRGTACPSSAQPDISAFSRDGAISTVGFVVGGVGIAASVVLYLTERGGKERRPAPPTGLAVHPWLSGTSGGVLGEF
jgi:hypothetical protein